YTAYFQRLEKSRLEVSFKWEADRMQNLVLSEEEFKKEIEVVKEERRLRTEDKPEGLTYEKFMATAFTKSNYRNPIIGWPQDLKNMKLADLQDWYAQFYAPNNATIVVAGDVDPDAVFVLAQKYFGTIPARRLTPTKGPVEPAQTKTRRITVRAPAKVPYLLMGYHVPVIKPGSVDEWEPYALEILAYILDGGKSARLNTQLVRGQQVASAAGVGYDPTSRFDTLFLFDANPAQGRSVSEVEEAFRGVIKQLQTELVGARELQRIKTQLKASRIYERDSVFYQAMKLGGLVTIGLPWQLDTSLLERLQAVTPQQIRSVAQKYLIDSNLTVAAMEPEPAKTSAVPHQRGS
ncbi:MAG: pitrilysin family protein, partial [Anaerolineales bacterium]|nr:pitrilysin family protein [Anaerolineales bacterium]